MTYEICLLFHVEGSGNISEVRYIVECSSYELAFREALTIKDASWPEKSLKDINVYLNE